MVRGFGASRFIYGFAVDAGEDFEEFEWEAVKAGCGMVGHATDGAEMWNGSRIFSRERPGLAFGGKILPSRVRASRRVARAPASVTR